MKILFIDHGKGYYTINGSENIQISDITRDDLFALLELICNRTIECEMDPYDPDLVQNKAHQVIYKDIYQKLKEVLDAKQTFVDTKITMYHSARTRYINELNELDETQLETAE